VTLLRFDSGLGLIYKPRSMAVDCAFQDLLDSTAARGFAPAFRRLRVLDAGDHGWAELVGAGGPLAACAGRRVRILLRLTMAYAGLLTDRQHPFVLGDALERDRLLRPPVGGGERPAGAGPGGPGRAARAAARRHPAAHRPARPRLPRQGH
jgi:lantibiotic modifying enzyme